MEAIRAVLADIDGVLTVSWRALPGAAAALRALRESGYKIALLTNTSSRTRNWIAATLRDQGFPVADADIFTVAGLTAAYLTRHHPGARCVVLNDGDLSTELPGVTIVGEEDPRPDVVVLGGAGPQFNYPTLNRVFGHLRRGADLVAMNANLYWQTDQGLMLDTGAFLPGLERAAGVTAVVTGKPAEAFFNTALEAVGVAPAQAVMVGDDIDNDVLAAQRLGVTGVLVRTGKYQASTTSASAVAPDFVLDSVADLPALLAGLPSAGLSPDRQISFVALGVGQSPPAGRVGVADDTAADRERSVDSGLHLVVRHVDVDVEAVAPGPGRLHLLEPERPALAVRVKQVLVAGFWVAEHRLPERPNAGDVHRVDRDLHVLHGRRVGQHLPPGRGGRDLPGQVGVPACQTLNLARAEPHSDALGAHIEVGVVARSGCQLADGGDQGKPGGECAGQKAGRRIPAAPQHPPVGDSGRG